MSHSRRRDSGRHALRRTFASPIQGFDVCGRLCRNPAASGGLCSRGCRRCDWTSFSCHAPDVIRLHDAAASWCDARARCRRAGAVMAGPGPRSWVRWVPAAAVAELIRTRSCPSWCGDQEHRPEGRRMREREARGSWGPGGRGRGSAGHCACRPGRGWRGQRRRCGRAAVRLLPVDGAAVSVMVDAGHREIVHASDAASTALAESQFSLGEGPCSEVHDHREGSGRCRRWRAWATVNDR